MKEQDKGKSKEVNHQTLIKDKFTIRQRHRKNRKYHYQKEMHLTNKKELSPTFKLRMLTKLYQE